MPSSVDEHLAGLAQGAQGVTLPPGLILGQGQQRPPPLPQRRLGRAGLSFGQDLAMAARTQRSLDADLLGVQAELIEPAGLDPAGLPLLELAQRRPRHSANASPLTYAARSGSPSASSSCPRRASRSKRWASTSSGGVVKR